MTYHPDVLAAHAEFGGDLEAMQALYDRPDHEKTITRLEREKEELRAQSDRFCDKYLAALKRAETAERQLEALRDEDAKLQLLHQQEDQIIEFERQLAERDADLVWARAALEPFDRVSSLFDHMTDDGGSVLVNVRLSELRAARAALAGSGDGWRDMAVQHAAKVLYQAFPDANALPGNVRYHAGEGHFFSALRLLFDPDALPASPSPAGER